MPKTLQLIRHAKSSWSDNSLSDLQRPLSNRGYADCELMGPVIAATNCDLNHVFCSPAERTQLTIKHLAKAMLGAGVNWHVDERLYTFDASCLLNWVKQCDDDIDVVTLVGHNPAITQLINQLSGADLQNFPTCAFAQLQTAVDSWSVLGEQTADLVHFLKPKMFK